VKWLCADECVVLLPWRVQQSQQAMSAAVGLVRTRVASAMLRQVQHSRHSQRPLRLQLGRQQVFQKM